MAIFVVITWDGPTDEPMDGRTRPLIEMRMMYPRGICSKLELTTNYLNTLTLNGAAIGLLLRLW